MKPILHLLVFAIVSSTPVVGASPEAEAAFRFAVAQSLAQEGSYRQALKAFEEVVKLAPEAPYVRLEYAEFLARLSRWRDASSQATAARQLAPANLDILRLVGRIELNLTETDPSAMDRAREAFEAVIELVPDDREASLSLGQIYLSQGLPSEAADLFQTLVESYPGDRTAASFLIEALQRAKRDDDLERALTSYLEQDPEFLKARMMLSRMQSDRGDHLSAADTLGEAGEGFREDPDIGRQLALELYRSGDSQRALSAVEDVLAGDPEDLQVRYLQAMIFMDLQRLSEAEAVVAGLVVEQPDSLQFQMALAQLRERQGKSKEAAAGLAKAAALFEERGRLQQAQSARLELAGIGVRSRDWQTVIVATRDLMDADSEIRAEAILLRGEALYQLERFDEALELLGEAESGSPIAVRVTAKRAEILFERNRVEEAQELLSGLTSEGDQEALLLAAEVYQRVERHDDAIPVLLRAKVGGPDSLQILFWLGAAYERTGQFPEAEEEFRRVLTLDPEFAPALNYLGYMWTEQGQNLSEALEMVNRAVELEPENGAYIDSLGWAYFQLGRYQEARDNLERAAELVPDDAVIVEHLGDLHQELGDLNQAAEYYQKALNLEGDNLEKVRQKLNEIGDEF